MTFILGLFASLAFTLGVFAAAESGSEYAWGMAALVGVSLFMMRTEEILNELKKQRIASVKKDSVSQ